MSGSQAEQLLKFLNRRNLQHIFVTAYLAVVHLNLKCFWNAFPIELDLNHHRTMNFLDTYDIAGSSTPPQLPDQPLNEEVQEVMGQLNRFWGGFRKQVCSFQASGRQAKYNMIPEPSRV